jgi:hypothetical protein
MWNVSFMEYDDYFIFVHNMCKLLSTENRVYSVFSSIITFLFYAPNTFYVLCDSLFFNP